MHKPSKGQAMIEFALILPLLLMVLFTIIDGALLIQGYLTVNHAAQEASRFAITYQPPKGTCLDWDGDGVKTDEPWPFCPDTPQGGYGENLSETEEDHQARRSRIIKLRATQRTLGLRSTVVCDEVPSRSCIEDHLNEPGMLGVELWGMPSFEAVPEEDHPSLEGLPVRVRVVHNVQLTVLGPLLPQPFVRVSAAAEQINEGLQAGYGNIAPPTLPAIPTFRPPGTPDPTVVIPPTPTFAPSPTPTPVHAHGLELNFEFAENVLPDQREHQVVAHVFDSSGQDVSGARVTFRTSYGSFDPSGTDPLPRIIRTDSNGLAEVSLYANEPGTAEIEAWVNYNNNFAIDEDEPSDIATKVWTASGPYLIVTDHNPAPLAWIGVELMDHPYVDNPYSLWWCPLDSDSAPIAERLAYPVEVAEETWDTAESVGVQVPSGVEGRYRIESHAGDGGNDACGSEPVAPSADIEIAPVTPDLQITDLQVLTPEEDRGAGTPISVTVEVWNSQPVTVTAGPFDVDVYLNLDAPPAVLELGEDKQWVGSLGPEATTVLTYYITTNELGTNNLWAQVDTSDYVDEGEEGGESNNVFGPVLFYTTDCRPDPRYSDDFDNGVGSQWQVANVNAGSNSSVSTNGEGQLEIYARGRSLWGATEDEFYYLYQEYEGDFDVRMRIVDPPTHRSNTGRVALHLRRAPDDPSSSFLHNAIYRSVFPPPPANRHQTGYRDTYRGNPQWLGSPINVSGLPMWVRITREGNSYDLYYSTVTTPTRPTHWTHQASHQPANPLNHIGIAHASESNGYDTSVIDDFVVCDQEAGTAPPDLKPPGLVECRELIKVPGFEGNPETVFEYWRAGGPNAFQRTSEEFSSGSFSMRMHASLGTYPCSQSVLEPYLYQEIHIPTQVYSTSSLVVDGDYLVKASSLPCSPDGPDAEDILYLRLQRQDGVDMTTPIEVTNGNTSVGAWAPRSTDLTGATDVQGLAGQTVRLYWNATHDEDYNGTFFYVDNLSAQVCTEWPVPPNQSGKASFGGNVSTLNEYNTLVMLPGADVWAYAQGGEVYHTQAIHDGTYHFYNIPPGNYVIYSEVWMSGELRTATTQLTVEADRHDYVANLLLQ